MAFTHKFVITDEDRALLGRFTRYLQRVADTGRKDYIRRQAYRRREILMDILPETAVYDEPLTVGEAALSRHFDFEERRLSDAFAQLPLLKRRILALSFVEGLPAQEIAVLLNCSVKFVYNQKHTALNKLRETLLQGGERYEL